LRRVLARIWLFAGAIAMLAACAGARPGAVRYDLRALPNGPVGASIAYGHAIVVNTQRLMRGYVRSDMSCSACHVGAGTQPRGGSFVGLYGRFPQWNKRAHRVIALQDRIAECFLYSMNGRAPAYSSRPMIAIVAYIAWLSRGTPVGAAQPQNDRYVVPLPDGQPSLAHGEQIYAAKCSACHQPNGGGISGIYPPLWGKRSFNRGAGMAKLDRMTGFVRYNMPANAPGSLSLLQAYDVAAFVLSHSRPSFRKNDLVLEPPLHAKYF
jgi:thiosulfate dehydrogenase